MGFPTKHTEEEGVYKAGYVIAPMPDFPATSKADTLYQTGKQPSFDDSADCQKLDYMGKDDSIADSVMSKIGDGKK